MSAAEPTPEDWDEVAEVVYDLPPCVCGHAMTKHLLIPVRVGQKERDRCTLCPCRLYRQAAA